MNVGEFEVMESLQYTREHEWLRKTSEGWELGVSDFASKEMGDVAFVELPEVGSRISKGEILVEIESVKAVSEILPPCDATVTEVNDALEDRPEDVNETPYQAWIVRFAGEIDESTLMGAQAYADYLETLQ